MPNTTTKATAAKVQKENPADLERVEIMVPRGAQNDDPNMFISVNGVNYLLPKGKKCTVPKEVAYEFYRSIEAQESLDDTVQEMMETANKQ